MVSLARASFSAGAISADRAIGLDSGAAVAGFASGSPHALATASRSAPAGGAPSASVDFASASAGAPAGARLAIDGNPLVEVYQVPAPPPASTVVPRKIFAASPNFPMALVPIRDLR